MTKEEAKDAVHGLDINGPQRDQFVQQPGVYNHEFWKKAMTPNREVARKKKDIST